MTGPETSPGAALRAEREALGVTVREVAETLNLSMSMIDAIETDDLERLPGPVFARGYVRAYARLLELDPRPLLEHFPKAQDPPPPEGAAPELPIWEWIRDRPVMVLGAAGAGVLVALLLLILALWPEGGDGDATMNDTSALDASTADVSTDDASSAAPVLDGAPETTATAPVGIEPPAAAAAPSARAPTSAPADARAGERAAALPDPATTGAEPTTVDASAPPAASDSELAASGAGPARRITATGDDRLSFGFSDDCWVEVKSGGGTRLYSNLGRAGAELQLIGQGPFRILLGYAPGVRLTFNGEPVPLAPHTRDNVATLVLGQ
ncbi:MAG: DUF4115 domain-containing protein [Pseudomonadales bacterium]